MSLAHPQFDIVCHNWTARQIAPHQHQISCHLSTSLWLHKQ